MIVDIYVIVVGIISIIAIPIGWKIGRELDGPKQPKQEVTKTVEFYN